jgi:hypothetical protein
MDLVMTVPELATGSERKGAKWLQRSNLIVEPALGANRFVILMSFPAGVASNSSAWPALRPNQFCPCLQESEPVV